MVEPPPAPLAEEALLAATLLFLDAAADIGLTFRAGMAFVAATLTYDAVERPGAEAPSEEEEEEEGPKLFPESFSSPSPSSSCVEGLAAAADVGAKKLAAPSSSAGLDEEGTMAAVAAASRLTNANEPKRPPAVPAVARLGPDDCGLPPGLHVASADLPEKSRIAPSLLVAIAWRCAGVMFTEDSGASCLAPTLPGPFSVGMAGLVVNCENDARPPPDEGVDCVVGCDACAGD